MKKTISILLSLLLSATALTACGTGAAQSSSPSAAQPAAGASSSAPASSSTGKKLVVATVPKAIGSNWFDSCDWRGTDWANENGAEHHYIGPTSMDSAAQLQCLNDAIALQPDVLTVIPIASDAVDELLKQAKAMNTKVVTHEGASLTNIDYNVDAFNNKDFGENFAQKAAELAGDDCTYVLSVGRLTVPSHNEWSAAFYNYATANYPNMKTVNQVAEGKLIPIESMDNSDESYKICKELIQGNPDLDVIFTASGSSVGGFARAIREMNKVGEIKLLAVGSPSGQKAEYEAGVVTYGAFWYPGDAQYACYEVGKRLVEGKEIKTGDNLGAPGYESITVDGKKIYGKAWYDVTQANIEEMAKIL